MGILSIRIAFFPVYDVIQGRKSRDSCIVRVEIAKKARKKFEIDENCQPTTSKSGVGLSTEKLSALRDASELSKIDFSGITLKRQQIDGRCDWNA